MTETQDRLEERVEALFDDVAFTDFACVDAAAYNRPRPQGRGGSVMATICSMPHVPGQTVPHWHTVVYTDPGQSQDIEAAARDVLLSWDAGGPASSVMVNLRAALELRHLEALRAALAPKAEEAPR